MTSIAPTEEEIQALESKLPEQPEGIGQPITDRKAWTALSATPAYKAVVAEAETLLHKPLPEVTDELYLEFSRTGSRDTWQNAENDRRRRLRPLVLAECVENKGRLLPNIEELIGVLCAERVWVLPAHDRKLQDFRGERISIDLWSSAMAWELATADWLLGEKLSPAVRATIRENVRRRVLDPFKKIFTDEGALKDNWWITAKQNWNTVCLAGVTGAAMEQIASRHERAEFLAAAVKCSQSYLDGYGDDGYCSEGLGYWNYGFGHYVLLAETVGQNTKLAVDLSQRPRVREIARFAQKAEIAPGVWPAFADCPASAKPENNLMYFLNGRMGLGLPQYSQLRNDGRLFEMVIYTFHAQGAITPASAPAPVLRDWFDKAGILVARPAAWSSCRLAVALKGGNNAENHNHNDLGSYLVVAGKSAVLLDPGGERYTARTFSAKRYDSKVLNSYGHPVPVVAGQLQKEGASSAAKVLRADFSDAADTFEMDISSAYPAVKDLKSLVRTFVYDRRGAGSLTVTDAVDMASPQSFGTALITGGGGTCKQLPDGRLHVQRGQDAVKVTIDTGGEAFKVSIEPTQEDCASKPTRIGIDLTRPVASAKITVRIEPAMAE